MPNDNDPIKRRFISAAQSSAVPYELPYRSALKALWAATFAHYGAGFSISGTNVSSQLGYKRGGESVGGEAYPYCIGDGTFGMTHLSSPYTYTKAGWISYFSEMLQWAGSQHPFMKVFAPINEAGSPTDRNYGTQEAAAAVVNGNGHGFVDGFGSQGLSASDQVNGCSSSTSDWCSSFGLWWKTGAPLELQQLSLSDETDADCMHGHGTNGPNCGTPPQDSGDLRVWLPFAQQNHMTILELYYHDAGLAFDPLYCTNINGSPRSSV